MPSGTPTPQQPPNPMDAYIAALFDHPPAPAVPLTDLRAVYRSLLLQRSIRDARETLAARYAPPPMSEGEPDARSH